MGRSPVHGVLPDIQEVHAFSISFEMEQAQGLNQYTQKYFDMTPERRKCAVRKTQQRSLLLDNT
jgi:hypothetical protein